MAITTYITVLADTIIDGATKASPSWLPWHKPNRCSGVCLQWGIAPHMPCGLSMGAANTGACVPRTCDAAYAGSATPTCLRKRE